MNEVTEMRESFGRIEQHLERFRWMMLNPSKAKAVFDTLAKRYGGTEPSSQEVVREIDRARGVGRASGSG